jgi:hypothetical protein
VDNHSFPNCYTFLSQSIASSNCGSTIIVFSTFVLQFGILLTTNWCIVRYQILSTSTSHVLFLLWTCVAMWHSEEILEFLMLVYHCYWLSSTVNLLNWIWENCNLQSSWGTVIWSFHLPPDIIEDSGVMSMSVVPLCTWNCNVILHVAEFAHLLTVFSLCNKWKGEHESL